MADFPNTIQYLNEFCKEFDKIVRSNLEYGDINAAHNLYNSINTHLIVGANRFDVVINLEDYWYYVENGRKAGRFPPINDILNWIKIKPVPPLESDSGKIPTEKQLAFLIARKIARDGTEPKPFLELSVDEALERFQEGIIEAFQKDATNYLTDILRLPAANLKTIDVRIRR